MASFFQIHAAPDANQTVRDQAAPWLEVCPPALSPRTPAVWRRTFQRFWNWLWDLDTLPDIALPRTQGLEAIRDEFLRALWDLQSTQVTVVREAIQSARSLRELWHLRADLFNVIAMYRGQTIATARLDILNAHFPVRMTPRCAEQRSSHTTQW